MIKPRAPRSNALTEVVVLGDCMERDVRSAMSAEILIVKKHFEERR